MSEFDMTATERSPWGVIVVAGSLGCLVGGILWPGMAETLLRLLIGSLALGWAAARALGMGLPGATIDRSFSPFDAVLTDAPPPSIPDVVQRRARVLAAIDKPDGGSDRPLPWPVLRSLVIEARRRVERGHGLRLDRPDDAERIRHVVSEDMWSLLTLGDVTHRSQHSAEEWTIPLSRLDALLDDMERL